MQLFYSFLNTYSEFMQYDVLSWLQEFYMASFFYMQLFLQLLSSILQSVEVWFKKHDLELFQYNSVLYDNRIELNSDQKAIVEMTRSNITPQLHAKLLNCQATSCTVELAKQFHAQVF